MDQETGRLYFDVLLNDESLQQGLQRSRESFRSLGETANAELQSMDGFMAKAAQTAAGLFAADKLKDFASAIATVRGEYQQLEIAFETMLGSKSQADALMAQLIDTAATTPFEMKEIAESSKMLLAYGMAADEVNGTLIRLGDIAAGLSIPIKDLAFLYGTTMVQGRLYTQDLNQFLGRGIPLADELAKQFGKNKSEVKKLVEEGKIGFPEVQKAIEALTNEGSKFGGLMEAQSKTISGQMSNIEDAWEQMMNEIGRSQEENISGALDITGKLIENWKTIGKVLLYVISIYGAYRAATMLAAIATRINAAAAQNMAYQQKLAAMQGVVLTNAQAGMAAATSTARYAFESLKTAFMSNPFGMLATAITTVISAIVIFRKEVDETTQMSERFGESAAKSIQQVDMLGTALMGLDEGTGVYKKTMDELNTILEEYGITQIKEGDNIDSINEKRKQAIELIKEEGVERQRLNAIQTANDAFEKNTEDATKKLGESLSKVSRDAVIDGHLVQLAMKEVNKNGKDLAPIIAEIVKENGRLTAEKTGEELKKGREQVYDIIIQHLQKMGYSSEELSGGRAFQTGGFTGGNALYDFIDAVGESVVARERAIDVAERNVKALKAESEATLTSAERIEAGQRKILNASKTADELYKNVSRIVKDFSENTLNFHINFDGEPPEWMLKMDFEETRRLAAWFTSKAEDMRRNNQKVAVFSNGKTMSAEAMAQEGLNYSKANQAQAARQEAARKKAEEDRKQAAKDAKAEAKRRAKAAADARKKAEEERKRIALEKHDLEKEIEKYKDSVIEKEYESSLEIRQNTINLLEDGYEKERQQIELNYERLLYENKKRSDAMVEAIKENKMREWKVANPKATKEKENAYRDKLDVNVTEKDLDPSQKAMLAQYESVVDKTKVKAMQDLYTRSIEGFQDYDTRRAKIAEEGAKKREEIERTHADYIKALNEEVTKAKAEKQAALDKFDAEAHTAAEQREKEALAKLEQIGDSKDRALAESKQKQEKDIKAVNDEEIESLQKTSALFVKLFGDASEKSRKELRGVITETENLLSYLRSTDDKDLVASFGFSEKQLHNLKQSPEKLKDITEQLKRLKDAAKDGNPFGELADAINDVFKKAEKGENLKPLEVRLKRLGASTAEAADEIGKIAAKLSALFEAAGSQNMAEQAEGLMNAMSTVSNIGKGFAQGGIVGAIEAGAMEVLGYVTKAFQAAAVHKKALLDIQKQINDQQLQYNELLRVEQREARDLETIFGSDKLTKARRSLLLAKDWEDDIKRSIKGDIKTLADYRFELEKKEQWQGGRLLVDTKTEGDNYGLGMFSIKTGHAKSGFFGLGKGRDLYSGLTQIAEYKDLVKANGHLNLELAKSIAATREFEGDGKKAFEALIKKEEDFEAALKQMDDYLGGIFGNYASDIMDAVIDAFERGTDAAEAFGDVTKKVMRNVAKDMVQAAVLQPVIQKQSELVKQAFASGNREEYIKALGEASRAFADVQKVAQEEYKNMADIFKKNGNDLTADSTASREASQKGIATASQDSVDELNGRMTAVQGHTFDIAENTRMLLATTNEILKGVVGIERNTGNVHTRLSVVEQHLKSVKDTVGDIALKGIKIKQ
nr:MAG TPA: tail tape measure protein [Caudoviricetes sp.]